MSTVEIRGERDAAEDTECPVEGCGERFYSDDLLTDHLDDAHRLRERVLRAEAVVFRD